STFAYVLLDGIRQLALAGTEWSNTRADTIRLRLIKTAARVRLTARRVVFHFASSYPFQSMFDRAMERLCNTS
ncbi:MAG: transposase, partial [Planctomycetota bacterium]